MKEYQLIPAKYKQALLATVGEPARIHGLVKGDTPKAPAVVLCFDADGEERNIFLEISDAKQMLYDLVRTLRMTDDPVAEELFQAFKGVFEARSKNEVHLDE